MALFIRFLMIGFVLSSANGCSPVNEPRQAPVTEKMTSMKTILGDEVFQIIQNSEKMTAFGTAPTFAPGNDNNAEYVALTKEHTVNTEVKKQLQDLLLADSSYRLDAQKRAVFIPNVGVHFFHQDKSLTVLFSLHSNQARFIYKETVKTLDYDPAKDEMVTTINNLNY